MSQIAEEKGSPTKQKKTYSQLHASPFSDHLKPFSTNTPCAKKIIPTIAQCGLREDFKKMFLPLLIDVFELRQMIDNYKMQQQSPELHYFSKTSKTPEEILSRLRQMQLEIEEAQRWCDGVVSQIAKGIEEAQNTLEYLQKATPRTSSKGGFRLLSFLKQRMAWLWKKRSPR